MMPTISKAEAMKRGYTYPNVQTILFSKDKFNRKSSTKWLKDHGYPAKYYRTTKNFIRRMIHSPVENAKYYTIQLPKNIQLVYQYFDDIDGAGLFTDLKDKLKKKVKTKATEIIDKYLPLRTHGLLPPSARNLLEQIGDLPITAMQVIRTPIESYINKALNLLSLGKWDQVVKEMGYDKLFHLSIFINNKYVLHKIEVINLAQSNPIKSNISETMNVNFKPTTIGQLIEDTRKLMGDQLFTSYNAKTNNCQHFISSILKANGSLTPELNTFINQNAEDIFKRLPQYVDKFATKITDIAARADRLLKGEGVHTLLTKVKRKLNQLKVPYTEVALSNRPTKKIMVVINGKRIHFGAKNSNTFLEGATKQKRDNYRKRHSLIYLKDGRRAIDFKYSPAWLSYYILW